MASNAQYFHAKKLKQFGDNKNDHINADDLYITASNITEVKNKNDNMNEKEFIPSEDIDHEMLKINLKRISYYQQAAALLKSESRVRITVRDYKLLAKIYQKMSELAFELKYRYEEDHQEVFYKFHNYHQEWDLESIDAKKKSIDYDNEANDDKKLEILKYICKLQKKYIYQEYNCNYLNIAGIETLESMSTKGQENPENKIQLLKFYIRYEDSKLWNDQTHRDILLKIISLEKYSKYCDMDSIEEYHKKLADIYFKSNSEDYFRLAQDHYMKSIKEKEIDLYITIGNLYFDKKLFNIAKIFYKKGLEQSDKNISLKNRFLEKIKPYDDVQRQPSSRLTESWNSTQFRSIKFDTANEKLFMVDSSCSDVNYQVQANFNDINDNNNSENSENFGDENKKYRTINENNNENIGVLGNKKMCLKKN